MRTDVKIGIVLSAIAVGVAAYYFSQSGDDDVRIAGGAQLAEGDASGASRASEKPTEKKPAKKEAAEKPAVVQPPVVMTPSPAARPTTQLSQSPPVVASQSPPAVATVEKDLGPAAGATPPTTQPAGARKPMFPPRPVATSAPTVDISLPPVRVARNEATAGAAKPGADVLPARTDRPKRAAEGADDAGRKPNDTEAKAKTHVVKEGDTFSTLAQQYYGSERYTRFLMAQNKHIKDPRALAVGATLQIPPVSEAKTEVPEKKAVAKAGRGQYLVKDNDTFYQIASVTLGDGTRWPEIYELNREVVGSSPRSLRPGQVLELPEEAKPAE